jgi:hydrogenase maturation protein HypF
VSSTGRRFDIQGTVQGVGFRPWVYRVALEQGVSGTVRNDSKGVTVEAWGPEASLDGFLDRLRTDLLPVATIEQIDTWPLDGPEPTGFSILASEHGSEREIAIPPDLATCADCLAELGDPEDRRFRYPFTNCTNCGPRFTITLDLPYDRPATTMAGFELCPRCRGEYEAPLDRRFHAQPNACRDCGPRLELLGALGVPVARRREALSATVAAVRRGEIVAVKGLGGFQLFVRADHDDAVDLLRERKHRWGKPLALMVANLAAAEQICRVDERAAELLSGPAAPIVLLPRLAGAPIAESVAPGNPRLGLMLPSTPLHHLLLAGIRRPVVATSGNRSDEPIAIDNDEAVDRLTGIADLFLVHDRPIARHADDSVTVFMSGRPRLLRRARGYAPRAVRLAGAAPSLLAVGAHMKNVVALSRGDHVFLSQHIGDMETPQAIAAFESVIADLGRMLEIEPTAVVHDLHPDYPSTAWAQRVTAVDGADPLVGLPTLAVQHHHAHLASCLADHQVAGRALGITWDGTGYGEDGTIWGGEALLGDAAGFDRVARLRPFRLPGGEAAVREPRRTALSVAYQALGNDILRASGLPPLDGLDDNAAQLYAQLIDTGLHSPWTSSAGRLFDAVAALTGIHQSVTFEGQAAMALEFAADETVADAYPLDVRETTTGPDEDRGDRPGLELDWRPTIAAVIDDLRTDVATGTIAAKFHNGLVDAIVELARHVDESRIALTGGCFQNVLLTTRARQALEEAGFEVLLHRQVPANDGGISLGQIAVGAARLNGQGATQ